MDRDRMAFYYRRSSSARLFGFLNNAWKWTYRYLGLEFVYRKFNPSSPQTIPTGFIWLIGIYVAFFGVASQRYENRVDLIENRANSILSQLEVPDVRNEILSSLSRVQNMWCPEKPNILNPITVFRSLIKKSEYDEMVELTRETIENWKKFLDSVSLSEANLNGAKLNGANLNDAKLMGVNLSKANLNDAILMGANLMGANLKQAYFVNANLKQADLRDAKISGANLSGAKLGEANLGGAILSDANLMGANLSKANLSKARLGKADIRGANLIGAKLGEANLGGAILFQTNGLKIEQLCEAKILYQVGLDEELKKLVEQKCPKLLEKP